MLKSKYVFLMQILANIKQDKKEAKNVEILLNKIITFHMHYTKSIKVSKLLMWVLCWLYLNSLISSEKIGENFFWK